jgi:RIO-like serine/threonine protein kinase
VATAPPPSTKSDLKRDALGRIALASHEGRLAVLRDTRAAAAPLRWLSRRLAAREAAALERLSSVRGVPRLVAFDGTTLVRSFLEGEPMHRARPRDAQYFRDALRVLRAVHRRGVAHNDLAKEANWLVLPDGGAAIVDFQIAWRARRRSAWFRALAREDLRHLIKHKRTYLPQRLSARQRALLEAPTLLTRTWRAAVKPLYRLVTRRWLGWPERNGPAERQW